MRILTVPQFTKSIILLTVLTVFFSFFFVDYFFVDYSFAETEQALNLKVDFIFIGLHENSLFIRQRIEAENTGREAIKATGSQLRIALPRYISPADYQATLNIEEATQSIDLIQVGETGVFLFDTLLSPGVSKIDVEYRIPFPADAVYSQTFLFSTPSFRLFTFPLSIIAEGPDIEPLSVDQELGAIRYRTRRGFEAGEKLVLALVPVEEEIPEEPAPMPSVQVGEVAPKLSRYQWIIIPGMTLVLLAGALLALKLRSGAAGATKNISENPRQILEDALGNLKQQHQAGLIDRMEYETRRRELVQKLEAVASARQSG